MPAIVDKLTIKCDFLDKRVKLLPCQRERMRWMWENGMSQNQLAKKYNVSKRLIQFCIHPDKAEQARADFLKRQADGRYYNKERHTEHMRAHRQHKREVLINK
jgi:hypothetical protein